MYKEDRLPQNQKEGILFLLVISIISVMWMIVVLLVRLVAGPLVGKVMRKLAGQSILLTIIGAWVGTKQISLDPFQNFFHKWFENFGISFWIELLIAQPIARFTMKKLHAKQASKAGTVHS